MQTRRKTRLGIALAVLVGLGLTIGLTLYALSANIDCRTCSVKGRAWWPRACWTASGILPPSRCWPNMMKITPRRR